MFEQHKLQTLSSQPILTIPDSKNDNKNENEEINPNQIIQFEKELTFPHI